MARTQQPAWHCVANLGDADPFSYGGQFLMIDRRGIYPAELWVFSEWLEESPQMTQHNIVLEHCFQIEDERCGVYTIGSNIHHPYSTEWFGSHHNLKGAADCMGMDIQELRLLFCGNPYDRAIAYKAVADYHGLANFDSNPRVFGTKREAKSFCNRMLAQIKKAEALPDGLGR
jgi:hypothetical protein